MENRASEAIGSLRTAWGRSSTAQRWLGAGLMLALGIAIGFGYYLNRPDYVVLVSQADPKDAAAIVARLQELKVPYRPTGDGYTITVPKTEQYTAKLALAQSGLPKGSNVGLELFDAPKFGATDFDRQVNYLRAQQGELERALVRIDEIEYANVKLAIPEKTVFTRDQKAVTAAVMLQTRPGRKLTADQITGVVNFVSSSVQGLTAENVKVVDQSGRLLSSGIGVETASGSANPDQTERQITLQYDLEQRVQTLLEPIFGAGNVIARVNLELNLDTSRIENQTVGNGAPKSTEVVRQAGQGAPAGTDATTTPGDPAAPPVYQGQIGTVPPPGDQWFSKTTTNFELSQRREVTVVAPGAVKRISVGIAVNRPDLTAAQIKQIQDSVAGATGAEVAAISVAAMAFRSDPQVTPAAQTASTLQLNPFTVGAAAVVLLLLGYLLFVRSRQRELVPETGALAVEEGVPPTHGATLDVALGMEQVAAASASMEVTRVDEDQPATSVEDLSAQERLEVIMRAKPRRQLNVEGHPVDPELMSHADELMHDSPEASAEVLRQWLKGGA